MTNLDESNNLHLFHIAEALDRLADTMLWREYRDLAAARDYNSIGDDLLMKRLNHLREVLPAKLPRTSN